MTDQTITVTVQDRDPVEVQITSGTRGPRGLNNYELWLAQGNSGTEADYLAVVNAQAAAAAASAASASDDADATAADRSAAETAKASAESARDSSIAARDDSIAAKAASETARDAALTAKTGAETARDASVTAKTASEAARDAGVTAKTAAETARDAAAASALSASTVLDMIDDRFLGAKASDPSVDNDGNALIVGASYFNTTSNATKVYRGGGVWDFVSATMLDLANGADEAKGATLVGHRGTTAARLLDRSQPALDLARIKSKIAAIEAGTSNSTASLLIFGDSIARSLIPSQAIFDLFKKHGFRGAWCSPLSAFESAPYSLANLGSASASGASATPTANYNLSPNGLYFALTAAGHRVTFVLPTAIRAYAINKHTIVYRTTPGGGTFKIQTVRPYAPDKGVDVVTIDTNGTEGLATYAVTLPAREVDARVSCLWQSGTVHIVGSLAEDTVSSGMIIGYMDAGGLDMDSSSTISQANLSVLLSLLHPDLITWSMKDGAAATVAPKLPVHQALWDAAYPTEWLYIAPYPDSTAATEAQARSSSQPIIDHAIAYGHDYWDTLIDIPTYAYAVAQGWMTDITHTNEKFQRAFGPKLWRASGLLPSMKTGAASDVQKAASAAFDTMVVNSVDFQLSLNRLREAALIAAGRGVTFSASGNNFVMQDAASASAPGTGSFTIMGLYRLPEWGGTLELCEFFGLIPASGTAGRVYLQMTSAGTPMITMRRADGTADDNFQCDDAVTVLPALAGQVIHLAIRRDAAPATGEVPLALFINGTRYPLNGQGSSATPAQDVQGKRLKLGAITQNTKTKSYECLGVADYRSALSDAQIMLAAATGIFPTGSLTRWRFDERTGLAVSGPTSDKKGVINNSVVWTLPLFPNPDTDTSSTNTLVVNTTRINTKVFNTARAVQTLPAAPGVGDYVELIGQGQDGWKIAQPAGHQIVEGAGATVGTNASTAGATGYIQSGGRYDCVRLRCVVADSTTPTYTWAMEKKQGAITYA
jgi:pyruvate/2-oxoglutarate dehydrogenase complex dihydrolipoamide acyltransferase (E2) component